MNDDPRDARVRRLPVAGNGAGAAAPPPPPGRLRMVITYLEMRERPRRPSLPRPAAKLALMRAEAPTLSFYRYLYETVGGPWMWYERRLLDDAALAAIVHDPAVEIFVLYCGGVPAGYAELDRRVAGEVELAYFGLVPEFIGRGLGAYFLDWAVRRAWAAGSPRRVWVHTCNFDHPKAIAVYQRAGFEPYDQEVRLIEDPRAAGARP